MWFEDSSDRVFHSALSGMAGSVPSEKWASFTDRGAAFVQHLLTSVVQVAQLLHDGPPTSNSTTPPNIGK